MWRRRATTVRRSTVHRLLPLLLLLTAGPSLADPVATSVSELTSDRVATPAAEPVATPARRSSSSEGGSVSSSTGSDSVAASASELTSGDRVATSVSEWTSDMHRWLVEQMPGGTVTMRDGALVIDDNAGCTVWLREKLTAPVVITYEATIVARDGPNDRVSDLNYFWMARDPQASDGCPFAPGHGRSGKFADYDSLLTYYVGFGGNVNSTTRFRRYDGTPVRPLLPEHDLSEKRFLLEANKTYRIKLVARDGVAEFWRNGEKIFSFRDPAPLTTGWFAFRTVKSHLEIRHFRADGTHAVEPRMDTN